jgi:hypothetical protein
LYAGEKYCFTEWAEVLKKFLGISLEVWAWENPTVWGNASTNILKFFVFILSIIFLRDNIDNTVLVNVNLMLKPNAKLD